MPPDWPAGHRACDLETGAERRLLKGGTCIRAQN